MALDLVEDYLAHLREAGCTDGTLTTFKWVLTAAHRDLPYGLPEACEDELRAWLWRADLRPASRATYYGALAGFFRHHHDGGELDWNPMADIKRPKVPPGLPRVARDPEVEIVLTQTAQPYRMWAKLAAYQGLRCIEVARLHREHITEQATYIHRGKGDKPGIVPTHPVVWEAVTDLPPGPMTDLSRQEISNRFKKACVRLGVPGVSMHRLRGWYATKSYGATKDLRAVQRNMRHANLATTAVYIDTPYDDQVAAAAALPTFGLLN